MLKHFAALAALLPLLLSTGVSAKTSPVTCQSVMLTAPALLKAQPAAQSRTLSHGRKGEVFALVMDGGSAHYLNGWWLVRKGDGRRFWVQRAQFTCTTGNQAAQNPPAKATVSKAVKPGWDSKDAKVFDQNFLSSCTAAIVESGAIPKPQGEEICHCALSEIKSRYTLSQVLAMSDAHDSQALEEIGSSCAVKTMQKHPPK